MFIKLIDIEGEEYWLYWWQIRSLKEKGKITTVRINIDGYLDAFDTEKPGKEIQQEIENNRAMMDVAA